MGSLTPAQGYNITAILDGFPDYSVYNGYLSQTKVCSKINSRKMVTCLVLPNAAMSALAARQPLAGIKNVLRSLTLLGYFDPQKLHVLPHGFGLLPSNAPVTHPQRPNAAASSSRRTMFPKQSRGFPALCSLMGPTASSTVVSDFNSGLHLSPASIEIL